MGKTGHLTKATGEAGPLRYPHRVRTGRSPLRLRYAALVILAVTPLAIVSCGSDEQASTSVVEPERVRVEEGEGPTGGSSTETTADGRDPFAPPSTVAGNGTGGTPEGGEPGGSPDSLDETVASRPANIPAERWWLITMNWVFSFDPANPSAVPESLTSAWANPENSDAGPEAAGELAQAGKDAVVNFLTTNPPDIERGGLPPTEGIIVHAASAAKTVNPSGGEPLYRVAVLWSAVKDRVTGKPAVNRMTEVLFAGEPGNWRQVPCRSISETACAAVFMEVL